MKSYFFNAESTEDLERYPTGYDREYDADDHADFFAPLLGPAGVLLGEGDEAPCEITAQGQTLHINAGTVYVKGRMAIFDGTETLAAASGHVVVRMNRSVEVRAFQLLIVAEPVQEDGDIYDLPLARVSVSDGNVVVTDERVYLTARVLGGHRHQAEDLDGVSTPGHRHSAADLDGVSTPGHTHGMEDIEPETVDEVATFSFRSPVGSYPALKMSRPGSGYSVGIGMNGGAVDIRSWNGDVKNTALRILCGGSAYAALKLIDTDSEGEAKNYFLFGQHNLPHFTGGYTGDGSSIRSVNLNQYGRTHKPNLLLIFASDAAVGGNIIAVVVGLSEDELGGYSECTVIKSNGSTVQSTNLGSGVYFNSGKSKLEISGIAAANLLNVSGVSYYYWGDRT